MATVSLKIAAQLLENYILNDTAVMMTGAPGMGKTSVVHQTGNRLNMDVLVFILSIRDAVDLRGMPYVDPKTGTTKWLPPSELPNLKNSAARGILFIDEINHASKSMQRAAMGLVLTRSIAEYHLPDGWVPVAAGNRLIDRADVERMGTALRNRFAHIEIGVDVDAWCEWALKAGVSPYLIAYIRLRPEVLHMMPVGDENAFSTPRSLVEASKYFNSPAELRFNLMAGLIGDGVAGEIETFLSVHAKMPNLDDIARNPMSVPVPSTDPSMCFALSSALARHATKATFTNIIRFLDRMPPEYGVLGVLDAVTIKPELKLTAAFTQWGLKHQDVVL